MSSSSCNYDSGHSGDDTALTSHQDIKPSIKNTKNNCAADNNSSSSQDDYTIDKFISNNKDGRSPTECEIEGLFQETNSKDVRSKPLTGEGDDIDGSYWLPSKPNVPKVSLDAAEEGKCLPLQPIDIDDNSNQLSLSSHITKLSSQQCEYTITNLVNDLNLPPSNRETIKHSSRRDMVGFATKEDSELDPLEKVVQPEILRQLDLMNGKITPKQYADEHVSGELI